MLRKTLICLWLTVAVCWALPSPGVNTASQASRNAVLSGDDLMDSIYSDCMRKDAVGCFKYKLFSFVDKVIGSNRDSVAIADGITLVKDMSAAADGAPRSNSDDIFGKVEHYLRTHTLKIDLKGEDVMGAVTSAGRALGEVGDVFGLTEEEEESSDELQEESRQKKKKGSKMLLPLLMALKLKAVALIPLALGAIALIAGKALLIGKIALLISGIIGLKKLLSHQKSVTYEIVSHPHHTSSHSHELHGHGSSYSAAASPDIGSYGTSGGGGGHGGWGRSTNDATDSHQLAYRAQMPVSTHTSGGHSLKH